MSVIVAPSPSSATPSLPAAANRGGSVIVQNKFAIPGWVCDLESYRRWAHSNDYPESGWVSFLDGDIFVDPDMETYLSHNQVKQAFNFGIGLALQNKRSGRFVPDRMLYSNPTANVSTEPDGLYAHWETFQSGRLRRVPGKEIDYIELEGTADMILEIVSKSSEKKDTVTLRELYARAQISEYWLVDVRKDAHRFEILRLSGGVFDSVPAHDGWLKSEVFGCSFQLVREIDPLGEPLFELKVQP